MPCKRNIDFYITWPMRLWKSHFFPLVWLISSFEEKVSFGRGEISCSGERALHLDVFTGKPRAAAGLLN